jgi:prevent-host-death family protein
MKKVPLSEVKDDLSKYLRLAETEEVVITRHGKPAGVQIGFASEDDWFDFRLERAPRFQRRIEQSRQSIEEGREASASRKSATSRPARSDRSIGMSLPMNQLPVVIVRIARSHRRPARTGWRGCRR